MGNTCKPMAVLFQCMTKFTTNKKKKKKKCKTGKKKKKKAKYQRCLNTINIENVQVLC